MFLKLSIIVFLKKRKICVIYGLFCLRYRNSNLCRFKNYTVQVR